MKRLIPSLLVLTLFIGLNGSRTGAELAEAGLFPSSAPDNEACQVYGKIKFVDNFADYQVKMVEHHEDLRVEYVDNFADEPGKWEVVEHHEDFSIEVVEHHEDFSVKVVDNFPGCD